SRLGSSARTRTMGPLSGAASRPRTAVPARGRGPLSAGDVAPPDSSLRTLENIRSVYLAPTNSDVVGRRGNDRSTRARGSARAATATGSAVPLAGDPAQ